MTSFTDELDEAALTAPLDGDAPAGEWLRHAKVYDDIKAAREQEPEYLPQGIWARELKQAEWPTVVRLTRDALSSRSKDLQLAAWLTEALAHLEGVAGLTAGLRVMTGLVSNVWADLHPPIDEDDGVEPRVLVLEWCDRHLPRAVQGIRITRPGTQLAEPVTLLTWDEAERRESRREAERESGDRRTRRRQQETSEAGEDEPSLQTVTTSIRLTPRAFYTDLIDHVDAARAAITELCETFDARCGEHQARLPKLDAMLSHARARAEEARDMLAAEAAEGGDTAGASGDDGEDAAHAGTDTAAGRPARPEPAAQDPIAVIDAIRDREQAYRALTTLAERLAQIDPHSPAPYLVRRAAGLKDQTFADLVMLLADDDRQRQHLFRLLGISDDDRTQEATAHANA